MASGDTYHKHDQFLEDLAFGVHSLDSVGNAAITMYLTNTAPVAGDSVFADLTSPVVANLSPAAFGAFTIAGQTSGVFTFKLPTLVRTASGGVGDFRYCGLYNDTPTSPADPLICWWDYESTITGMDSGDTFTISFSGNTFQIGA